MALYWLRSSSRFAKISLKIGFAMKFANRKYMEIQRLRFTQGQEKWVLEVRMWMG
jgi:hypothetical protein